MLAIKVWMLRIYILAVTLALVAVIIYGLLAFVLPIESSYIPRDA